MNKGLLYGLGSIVALIAAKSAKRKGGLNIQYPSSCNSCEINTEYSYKDLYHIMNECGYYLPQTAQIFEEMIADSLDDNTGSGSFSKVNWNEVLNKAVKDKTITQNNLDTFLSIYKTELTKEQQIELQQLIGKLESYQVQILFAIGIEKKTTAKSISQLLKSVGSRIFINRYLQRTAFIIDEENINSPLFQQKETYKRQWVCDRLNEISDYLVAIGLVGEEKEEIEDIMAQGELTQTELIYKERGYKQKNKAKLERQKKLQEIINEQEFRLNKLGLDLNKARLQFNRTTTGRIQKDKPLTEFESLEKLSEVVWFIEMAHQCDVLNRKDLFYTFPQETVFSRNIANLSIFDQLSYKTHIPAINQGNLATTFPNVAKEFGDQDIKSLIDRGLLVVNESLHKPYIYFYKEESPVTLCFYSFASGYMTSNRTPVFTKTSKMNTISFSIPAGPPSAGGSCISSAASKTSAQPSFGVNDSTYVCQKCYALKNRYQMLDYVFSSAPRMNWITSTLTPAIKDISKATDFAILLGLAIESYSRYGYENGREILEIGFIQNEKLNYRSSKNTFSHIEPCDITKNISKLSAQQLSQPVTSQSFIDFNKIGDVAGYFRIHDSGDFSITSSPTIPKLYIMSWGLIAECFPQVKFWAPTRLWNKKYIQEDEIIKRNAKNVLVAASAFKERLKQTFTPQVLHSLKMQKIQVQGLDEKDLNKKYLKLFEAVCKGKDNLIIRPSGLTVVSPFNNQFIGIPQVYLFNPEYSSIAAGSGVNAVFVKNSSGNDFTDAAYKYIGTNEAFKRYQQIQKDKGTERSNQLTKLAFKKIILNFLVGYFSKVYNRNGESLKDLPKKSYTPIFSQAYLDNDKTSLTHQCPVDKATNSKGEAISSASSCMGSGCRFCWLAKKNCVTYGEH